MAIINVSFKSSHGFVKRQIVKIEGLSKKHTFKLAVATEKEIAETIRELAKRPGSTGHLADSFHAEITAFGAGVGRISFLNKEVPYWRHQNDGSLAINANWQHRVPKGEFQPGDSQPAADSFRDGRWNTPGSYSFIPKNPIPAMNYIEKSLAKILSKAKSIIKE